MLSFLWEMEPLGYYGKKQMQGFSKKINTSCKKSGLLCITDIQWVICGLNISLKNHGSPVPMEPFLYHCGKYDGKSGCCQVETIFIDRKGKQGKAKGV